MGTTGQNYSLLLPDCSCPLGYWDNFPYQSDCQRNLYTFLFKTIIFLNKTKKLAPLNVQTAHRIYHVFHVLAIKIKIILELLVISVHVLSNIIAIYQFKATASNALFVAQIVLQIHLV